MFLQLSAPSLLLFFCTLLIFLPPLPSLQLLFPHQLWVVDSTKPEIWKMSHILVILPHLSQHAALLTELTKLHHHQTCHPSSSSSSSWSLIPPPRLFLFLLPPHHTASSHSVSPSGLVLAVRRGQAIKALVRICSELGSWGRYRQNTVCIVRLLVLCCRVWKLRTIGAFVSDSKQSRGGKKWEQRSVLNQLFFLKAIWKAPHLLPHTPPSYSCCCAGSRNLPAF